MEDLELKGVYPKPCEPLSKLLVSLRGHGKVGESPCFWCGDLVSSPCFFKRIVDSWKCPADLVQRINRASCRTNTNLTCPTRLGRCHTGAVLREVLCQKVHLKRRSGRSEVCGHVAMWPKWISVVLWLPMRARVCWEKQGTPVLIC